MTRRSGAARVRALVRGSASSSGALCETAAGPATHERPVERQPRAAPRTEPLACFAEELGAQPYRAAVHRGDEAAVYADRKAVPPARCPVDHARALERHLRPPASEPDEDWRPRPRLPGIPSPGPPRPEVRSDDGAAPKLRRKSRLNWALLA